jgi:hypothetical protein
MAVTLLTVSLPFWFRLKLTDERVSLAEGSPLIYDMYIMKRGMNESNPG